MPMSIAIDATHYGTDRPTGVEMYVDNLLPKLSRLLMNGGATVSWIGHAASAPEGMPSGVAWVSSPHKRLWSQTGLLATLGTLKPDLFFTPSGLPPLRYEGKTALTIHDMAAYVDPGSFSFGQRFRLRTLSSRAAKKASLILSPSEYTRGEAARIWKIDPSLISITPLAFEPSFVDGEAVEGVRPGSRVILFVGRVERKKNLLPLVEAFGTLASEDAVLVLAGKDGYGSAEVDAAIASLPEKARIRVIRTGYISDCQKHWLYGQAAIAACPCPVEGFGIPALEAFCEGVPVVAANAGSLPEVCGEAAAYAQADSAADWKRQIDALLTDAKKAEGLVAAGSVRLKEYSWDRTAELTAKALLS